MDKYQPLLWVLIILCGYYQLASCNIWSGENCSEYCIHSQCSSQPCMSISEFANNLSNYLQPCTHLVLQPGNHTLTSPLVISNAKKFFISTYTNFSSATIACTNQFMIINFEHISDLCIDGVIFIRCQTIVNSTKNYTLQDSSFFGIDLTGTALVLVNTTSYLSNCSFTQFHGTQFDGATVGGAIITSHSTLHMYDCVLENNKAQIGGALFLKQNSSLLLMNCILNHNHDHLRHSRHILTKGGAIFIHHDCRITITNSTFTNNTARQGGVLYIEGQSVPNAKVDIILSNSTFSHNSGRDGGVIYVSYQNIEVYNGHFIRNTASYDGGVFHSYKANISINGSDFVSSTAQYRGGVLYASHTKTIITSSGFYNNSASSSGGVVYINYNGNTNINVSKFCHNFANFYGGVISVYHNTITNISNCNFTHNYANQRGGVLFGYYANSNIQKSNFMHNTASRFGGAVFALYANIFIYSSSFFDNTAIYSGAGALSLGCSIMEVYNTNLSQNDGYIGGAFDLQETAAKIIGGIFVNNTAEYYGGALYADNTYAQTAVNSSCFVNKIPHNDLVIDTVKVTIIDSEMAYNSAKFGGAIYLIKCNTVIENSEQRSNLAQYGGAIYALDSNTTVVQLLTMDNTANVVGIIVLFDGTLDISESVFTDNKAFGVLSLTGCESTFRGNINFTSNIGSLSILTSVVEFIGNSTFSNNSPLPEHITPVSEGGAMTIFQSNVKFSGATTFLNNHAMDGGAILAGESSIFSDGHLKITNNTASSSGGGIYLYRSRVDIKGSCTIAENEAVKKGGGINNISSSVTTQDNGLFQSSITFTGNEAMFGGALYLQANNKLYIVLLNSVVHTIHFYDNIAECGGAIYIADETNRDTCIGNVESSTPTSSTDCFFQTLAFFSENIDSANEVLNNTLNFTHNVAKQAGGNLFGGLLDRCTISPVSSTRKRNHSNGIEFLSSISNINFDNLTSESISSNPVSICFCKNGEHKCDYTWPLIKVKQGETFEISLVAVDHVNHPLKTRIATSLSSDHSGLSEGQHSQEVSTMCTSLSFTVTAPDSVQEDTILLHADGPCSDADKSLKYVRVRFNNCDCPLGFQRDDNLPTTCECTCHENITKLVENCNTSVETFTRKQNSWISYVSLNKSENMTSYFLLTHLYCPYDYCTPPSITKQSKIDKVCSMNRTGILCGACEIGLSVSIGSSKCMKCDKYWPALLILMVVVTLVSGIAIVCVILFLNITVATGTLNGIIFYANIIAANNSIFLRLLIPNFPSVFISWLNLDIGFDLCLYEGMDTYAKIWLQLLFPSYVMALVFIVIIVSKYSQKFSNILGKRNPVAALATLILLSYAKALSTIIKILSHTEVVFPDGSQTQWLPDANIIYLKDLKHLFLFLVGMLILVAGIGYTFIVFSWQWLLRLPNWKLFRWSRGTKLNYFIKTYHAPYTHGYRYWTGLLLLIRVILYLVSALNPSGDLNIPLVTTILLFTFLLLLDKNIHKKRIVGALESTIYFNIIVLAAFSWYTAVDNDETKQQLQAAVIYLSAMTTFALLFMVIVYHSYQYTKLQFLMQKVGIKKLKIKGFRFSKRQHKNEVGTREPSDTERDIDIFELVDSSMNTTDIQPAKSPNSTQKVTITDIPRPRDNESDNQAENEEKLHSSSAIGDSAKR